MAAGVPHGFWASCVPGKCTESEKIAAAAKLEKNWPAATSARSTFPGAKRLMNGETGGGLRLIAGPGIDQ